MLCPGESTQWPLTPDFRKAITEASGNRNLRKTVGRLTALDRKHTAGPVLHYKPHDSIQFAETVS